MAIQERIGLGIDVAGSGISGCGNVIGLGCDITGRVSNARALWQVVFADSGPDTVVVTADAYVRSHKGGRLPYAAWC